MSEDIMDVIAVDSASSMDYDYGSQSTSLHSRVANTRISVVGGGRVCMNIEHLFKGLRLDWNRKPAGPGVYHR